MIIDTKQLFVTTTGLDVSFYSTVRMHTLFISQALDSQQDPQQRALPERATAVGGPFPLENVSFVPDPPAAPGLCDHPGMLPLPRNTKDDVLFFRERDTHPLYPGLLLCLGHSNLESLVFFLPYRLQRLAQDSSTDPQIRHVLAVEGVIGLELVDLCQVCEVRVSLGVIQ